MNPPARALRRARRPDGRPAWLWIDGGVLQDLSEGGMADDLAEAAAWMLDVPRRAGLLELAPRVQADDWPVLIPGRPGKALCLGKNFAAHAREFGSEPPEELLWFVKLTSVLIGPGEPVVIPPWLGRVDPEAEVVALVGAPLQQASEAECAAAIAAYALGNDVTARKQQGDDRKQGWPWLRSKNVASFGPMGPEWVPAPSLPDFDSLVLRGLVNGEVRQEAPLGDMEWSPARALAEISRWTPLEAGDVVFLGTPAGVAPITAGDVLAVEVEGIGRLENPVTAG